MDGSEVDAVMFDDANIAGAVLVDIKVEGIKKDDINVVGAEVIGVELVLRWTLLILTNKRHLPFQHMHL